MKRGVMAVVAGVHGVIVGALVLVQGCRTTPTTAVPTGTVMPPATKEEPMPPVAEVKPAEAAPVAPVAVEPKVYTVKSGDSLSYIGKRFNASVRDLASMNKIGNVDKLKVGQKLVLPDYVDLNAPEPPRPKRKAVAKPVQAAGPVEAGSEEYVVKNGDMLSSIAYRNGTTVQALMEVNSLTSDRLRIGQKLRLPVAAEGGKPAAGEAAAALAPEAAPAVPTAGPEATAPGVVLHQVLEGQDLTQIAMMYQVRMEDLMQLNNLTNNEVRAGQTLKIPPSVE